MKTDFWETKKTISERMNTYHRNRRIDPASAPRHYEIEFIGRDREPRDVLVTIDMIADTKTSVGSFSDITELKRTLKRKKELQAELSIALAKVLGGFIPICANCKKIRGDEKRCDCQSAFSMPRPPASLAALASNVVFSYANCQ